MSAKVGRLRRTLERQPDRQRSQRHLRNGPGADATVAPATPASLLPERLQTEAPAAPSGKPASKAEGGAQPPKNTTPLAQWQRVWAQIEAGLATGNWLRWLAIPIVIALIAASSSGSIAANRRKPFRHLSPRSSKRRRLVYHPPTAPRACPAWRRSNASRNSAPTPSRTSRCRRGSSLGPDALSRALSIKNRAEHPHTAAAE